MAGSPVPAETCAIGRRLKLARVRAGRRLADVAEQAGMRPQALSRLERDEVDPKWSTVERVARALGLDLARTIDEAEGEPTE